MEAWLADHPEIETVSRDRAVRKSIRIIRTAIGATTINPDLLTYVERLQYEGYLRREETNAAIMKLAGEGNPSRRSCAAPVTVANSYAK
ncbi:hypothetical protein X767_31450 [Mesorhizobium sp. LSJC264A00]|nr:hypothetical protein X767_31450 [Mesorhizobium sp. LSJC264A00]